MSLFPECFPSKFLTRNTSGVSDFIDQVQTLERVRDASPPSRYKPITGSPALQDAITAFTPFTLDKMPDGVSAIDAQEQIVQHGSQSAKKAGQAFGKVLSQTSGGLVWIALNKHNQTAHWSFLVSAIKELKDDPRPLIILDEQPVLDQSGQLTQQQAFYNSFQELTGKDRRYLGRELSHALHGTYALDGYEALYQDLAQTEDEKLWTLVPKPRALDAIASVRPDVIVSDFDINYYADQSSSSSAPLDRDTAMAFFTDCVRQRYPDAIIVCLNGVDHGLEYVPDGNSAQQDIREHNTNMDDPFAEQLALLYGRDRVLTSYIHPIGLHLHHDRFGQNVYAHTGVIDYIVPVRAQGKFWSGL